MKTYRLTSATEPCVVIRESDGAYIPPDPENMDYWEYLTWVSLGNRPERAATMSLAEALTALSTTYRDDLDIMNLQWLAASVSGGEEGENKKADIMVDISTRKSQFASDVAQLKQQYGV